MNASALDGNLQRLERLKEQVEAQEKTAQKYRRICVSKIKSNFNVWQQEFTFVWNSMSALYPVFAQLISVFPPSSTQGTVRIELEMEDET